MFSVKGNIPFTLPWTGNFMFNDKSSKDYTIQIYSGTINNQKEPKSKQKP